MDARKREAKVFMDDQPYGSCIECGWKFCVDSGVGGIWCGNCFCCNTVFYELHSMPDIQTDKANDAFDSARIESEDHY